MSTTAAGAGVVDTTGAVSAEKKTYRFYAKYGENGEITDSKAKQGAQKLDETTGVPVNWKKLEDAGYTALAENEGVFYTAKSAAGFELLVPDETQRLYIIQCGLNYIQNAAINKFVSALKEGTNEPEYADQTIDLRESINEAPGRQRTTELDKLVKMLTAMGIAPDKQAETIATIMAAKEASLVGAEVEEPAVA